MQGPVRISFGPRIIDECELVAPWTTRVLIFAGSLDQLHCQIDCIQIRVEDPPRRRPRGYRFSASRLRRSTALRGELVGQDIQGPAQRRTKRSARERVTQKPSGRVTSSVVSSPAEREQLGGKLRRFGSDVALYA